MNVQNIIKKGNRKLSKLSNINSYRFHVLPGHYYSPLVSDEFIKKYEDRIFDHSSKDILGVDLNEEEQLSL